MKVQNCTQNITLLYHFTCHVEKNNSLNKDDYKNIYP